MLCRGKSEGASRPFLHRSFGWEVAASARACQLHARGGRYGTIPQSPKTAGGLRRSNTCPGGPGSSGHQPAALLSAVRSWQRRPQLVSQPKLAESPLSHRGDCGVGRPRLDPSLRASTEISAASSMHKPRTRNATAKRRKNGQTLCARSLHRLHGGLSLYVLGSSRHGSTQASLSKSRQK